MKPNLLVIDLSHWDPAADYRRVKAAGIVGVVYKATQGSENNDHTYPAQRRQALDAGLLWGAYHFGDGTAPDAQAQNFLTFAKVAPGDLFCLDYEDNEESQMKIWQAEEFVGRVEQELGRLGQCVLYSGNLIKETMRERDQLFWGERRLWLAQYSSVAHVPAPWAKYWLWQYTDGMDGPLPHGVDGAGKHIDCNHFSGTPEELKEEWAAGPSRRPPVIG